MRLTILATTAVLLCSQALASAADIPETRVGAKLSVVLDMLQTGEVPEAETLFAPSFLAQVPEAQLKGVAVQVGANMFQHGQISVVEIEPGADEDNLIAVLTSDKTDAYFRLIVGLDENELIEDLLIRPAPGYGQPEAESWDDVDALLTDLPGVTNLGVYELTDTIEAVHQLNPDARLATGSTFKLWVLLGLAERIAAEDDLNWDTEIPIQMEFKSLPSGTMQNIPSGKTRPLSEFATKMISISDNTATDHLIEFVGRRRVEETMARHSSEPGLNTPFLKTMDMFRLKLSDDAGPRDAFIAAEGDEEEQRRIVNELVPGLNPNIATIQAWANGGKPKQIDTLEWFATPAELASTFTALNDLEAAEGSEPLTTALVTNPGMNFDPGAWTQVAYKGGSEPGVLNMTWRLTRDDGRVFVLTVAWNNPEAPVTTETILGIADVAAKLLAEHDR